MCLLYSARIHTNQSRCIARNPQNHWMVWSSGMFNCFVYSRVLRLINLTSQICKLIFGFFLSLVFVLKLRSNLSSLFDFRDYHVFLLVCPPILASSAATSNMTIGFPPMIFDFDTYLRRPCSASVYLQQTCHADSHSLQPRRQQARFRLVPAADYLAVFASDRM